MGLTVVYIIVAVLVFFLLGYVAFFIQCFKKVQQGKAIVRSGRGGIQVAFDDGIMVIPVMHKMEIMDISVKRMEIARMQKDGLICKDNLRADIKVVFFVRVNKDTDSVAKVAQTIGCERASDQALLEHLFEAKFSEALKSVGKKFNFVDLYNSRKEFRDEIWNQIGTDLNGYVLEDIAIDYLEQTLIEHLDPDNILDSEGIRKISELTASQKVQANFIRNDEIKRIKKQDVERSEAVRELERQDSESEQKQRKEIASIKAREESEQSKIESEEKLKSEKARIAAEEEIEISTKNKEKEVMLAELAKQRSKAIEEQRIQKDCALEVNEKERVVELAQIEKEKALEGERKNIQDVIRERIVVEKAVVMEEEKIKDTKAFALANREKDVAITNAEKKAQESLVQELKAAEAAMQAAEMKAKQKVIESEAEREAAGKNSEAKKIMAEALASEIAAQGLAEAQVLNAKAGAAAKKGEVDAKIIEQIAQADAKGIEVRAEAQAEANDRLGKVDAQLSINRGLAEAEVSEKKAVAEAKGIEAMAAAMEKQGLMEAKVFEEKGMADLKVFDKRSASEASGIEVRAIAVEKQGMAEARVSEQKALVESIRIKAEAEALKSMDEVGKDMERFKLELQKDKEIALENIRTKVAIANATSAALTEAFKSSKINIIGGETMFYEKIIQAITRGQAVDGFVDNSRLLTGVKDMLLSGEGGSLPEKIKGLINQFGISSEDVKNMSIAALIFKMSGLAQDGNMRDTLDTMLNTAKGLGFADKKLGDLGLN